jgi:hypothetical protein
MKKNGLRKEPWTGQRSKWQSLRDQTLSVPNPVGKPRELFALELKPRTLMVRILGVKGWEEDTRPPLGLVFPLMKRVRFIL